MSEETGAPEDGQGTDSEGQEAPAWVETLDADRRAFVDNKGWKTPDDALTGYQNLEKVLGADRAGRTVVMPKEGEDAGEFWQKLGRPETIDGYEIKAPEGQEIDPEFAGWARDTFLAGNLTKGQADHLVEKWNEFQQGQVQKLEEARQAQEQELQAEARKTWGADFNQMKTYADRALAKFAGEEADGLIDGMGFKALEVFAKVGRAMAEDQAVGMNGQSGSFEDAQSLEAQRSALTADPAFRSQMTDPTNPGHQAAVTRLRNLDLRIADIRSRA